jgi:hypothetical protein
MWYHVFYTLVFVCEVILVYRATATKPKSEPSNDNAGGRTFHLGSGYGRKLY